MSGGADDGRSLQTPPLQSKSQPPSPSAAAAADHKRFILALQPGDPVDVADATLTTWIVGRVAGLDSSAFEIVPLTANSNMKAEWIAKSSPRIGRPHSHPATNKNMRQQESVGGSAAPAAAAGLATLAVPSPAHTPAASPSSGSSQSKSAGSSHLPLPLPAAPRSPGATPVPAGSPLPSLSPSPSPQPHPSAVAGAPLPAASLASGGAGSGASAPAASASASAAPSMSDSELKSFRSSLKVGDLVDFDSDKHRRHGVSGRGSWYLGEVSRIDKSWAGLRSDDVSIHNHEFGDVEIMPRDSGRLWPPFTKSAQQQQQQQAPAQQQQPQASAPLAGQNVAHPPSSARGAAAAPVQGRPGNLAGSAAAGSAPGGAAPPPAYAAVVAGNAPAAVGGAEGAHQPQPGAAAPVAVAVNNPTPANGQVPADRVPPAVPNFGFQLRRGDVCDCLDTEQKWRLSEVIGADSTHLLIHYVDWSSKWDEWILKGDPRIQPPRTRTEGYTGPANKKPVQQAAPGAPYVPVVKAPPPAPVPPPRPSYSCLAACSWQRVCSTGMSHKEIAALSDVFASCCYVQDSYQEVLLGSMGGNVTPLNGNSHSFSSYWSPPPAANVFKHTLASVTELLSKLETDIARLQSTLPSLCAFPLSQCAAMASNIRALILDSEETTRRQLLSQQEDEYMKALDKKFRVVTIPSDGSCLFSAVGMGQQIQKAVVALQEAQKDDAGSQPMEDAVKPSADSQSAAASSAPVASSGGSSSSSGGSGGANRDVSMSDGDAPVKMEDVQVSVSETPQGGASSDPSESGAVQTSKPNPTPKAKPDPLQVLALLRQSCDPKLQQQVAAKCRAELVEFLRSHSVAAGEGSASASSSSASASPPSVHSWLDKIQSEVKEVLQQESAGKYSDATSKAVWEELQKQAQQLQQQQQPSQSPSSADGAAKSSSAASTPTPTPLQLADTAAAVSSYIKVMSQEGIYGTGLEVEALSEMMRAPIHIYYRSEASAQPSAPGANGEATMSLLPERVIGEEYPGPPIALAFFMGNKHYNLLVDRSHIPEAPAKSLAPAAAPAAADGASASAAPAKAGEVDSVAMEEEGAVDQHAMAPGGVHTSPNPPDAVMSSGEIPSASPPAPTQTPTPTPASAPVSSHEPGEPGSAGAAVTGTAPAATSHASHEGSTPGGPVPTIAPAPASSSVPAAATAPSSSASSSSSSVPASGSSFSPVVPGSGSRGSKPPKSRSSSPATSARSTPKTGPMATPPLPPGPFTVQVPITSTHASALPHQSAQRTPPILPRVPSSGSLSRGSSSGAPLPRVPSSGSLGSATPPSSSRSLSFAAGSPADADLATITLEVRGPGSRRVQLTMRRDQPISALAPRLPAANSLPYRFYVHESPDWLEVSGMCTPDELGLKPNAHIGIKP